MNSTSLTISLGQFEVRAGDPDSNLAVVRDLIAEAARRGSTILVLPELWDTGYALDQALELGSGSREGRFAEVAWLAQEHGIHVIGSMLELGHPVGTSRAAYNTAMWFAADGTVPGYYRKVHLFKKFEEDRYLLPGGQPNWLAMPWGMTGIAICYDLRFPELFRQYAMAGVEIMFVPAQWPHPRLAHWQTLLRARAIENQMVVVACNRTGESAGASFCGHSLIVDAWGNTIIEAGERADLITASVDISHVAQLRRDWPVLDDRRPDAYDIG